MIQDAFQLAGKNALVTGSRRGLGAAIALALVQAGANVACHGRREDSNDVCGTIRSYGGKSFYLSGDVADPEFCEVL
jgi:2-deoxy-D-gluconate 3-dehydrogenase